MDDYEQEIALIKKILQKNPKGMTVTDISRKIKINSNSVAKYLDIMRISGHVEMITFGPAKVFFPSKRVPISDMLNYASDYIIIYDNKLRVTMVNDAFLNFLNTSREEITGQIVPNTISLLFKDKSELILAIQEALNGRDYSTNINFEGLGQKFYFTIKIKPTTFEDGRHGATIIIKNNSGKMLAENALKESENNFRKLLQK